MPLKRYVTSTLVASLTAVLITVLGGCGSMLSTAELSSARLAIERADELMAEQHAVYEYVSAVTYLDKAREEWGRSDFQKAVDYARRAQDFADQAYERALRDPTRVRSPLPGEPGER